MSMVRKIYKADWRSLTVTAADIETPKGLVRVRFIYDRASGSFFWAIPGNVSFRELDLSRAKTDDLIAKAKKACLWRIAVTDKERKDKEELAEFRKKNRTCKGSHSRKAPKEQQELVF